MTQHGLSHPTLCRLPAPGAWFWLVRPTTAEEAATLGLVLLHALPGLLERFGAEVLGHG